jgi:peptide deformylase
MKIKKIEETQITPEDVTAFKEAISKLEGYAFTASDVNIDKRIIAIRFTDNELVLVNPKVVETNETPLVYYEKDSNKEKKIRKTIRYPQLIVDTDNLGKVEFKATKNQWENADEFFGDEGLLEAVIAQRLIDAIDGIDITHPQRQYSETITKDKEPGRNERIMLQSDKGEMVFVKAKKAQSYIDKGYTKI